MKLNGFMSLSESTIVGALSWDFSSSGVVAGGGIAIVVKGAIANALAGASTGCGAATAGCDGSCSVGSARGGRAGGNGASIPRGKSNGGAEGGQQEHDNDNGSEELRRPLCDEKAFCGLPRRGGLCLSHGFEWERVYFFRASLHDGMLL